MNLKEIKDLIIKFTFGKDYISEEVKDAQEYFRDFNISFDHHVEDNVIVAVSNNFRYGSIIASGKDYEELDHNIKDAIYTAFSIPSAYSDQIELFKKGDKKMLYATT
ncbi:MAG: hypothetical protein KAT32_04705 [Candidatus Moranbacteria bacterium]|nr:hypothetical protein [Candidatus Moranbacteria bacterium]